jgi:hypothetical protein
MRRVKPVLLGSILIVLLCVLFFLRAQDDPGNSFVPEQEKKSAPPPPSVEQLQSQVEKETGALEALPGMVPPEVRFKEDEKTTPTLPSNRWFDGARTPTTPEEWEVQFFLKDTKKKTSQKKKGS